MCPVVLRMLMNMYINQQIQVKWNNAISKQSNIKNGVIQGVAYLLVFLAFT